MDNEFATLQRRVAALEATEVPMPRVTKVNEEGNP